MRLFDGLDTTDYADLLRALGREIDIGGARDLRLVETDAGLTVQARPAAGRRAPFATTHHHDEALVALLRAAYARRGPPDQGHPRAGPPGLTYEQALRALGTLADRAGLRRLRVVEQPGAFLLQGVPGGILRRGYRTHRLTAGQLHAALTAARRGELPILPPPLA